jgi:TolB-like protein
VLVAPPTPEEIPGLEASWAADRGDVATGLRLAAAYRGAERGDDARVLVTELGETAPDEPGVLVMGGLLAEDALDWTAARVAYQQSLSSGATGPLRGEVEQRIEVVRREELRTEVRASLAREDEVAQTSPDPATVGVFPFLYVGDDPQWEPLALALPEMLTTDLGITGRLRVLERIHVQALLDEMALGESGRVDEATAARSGRLLGSGNIVQGSLRIDDGTRVGVDAAVVEVGAAGQARVDPLSDEDRVEQLFALEKRLALALHEELGIQLTPAERERINERQTESVQALLEFGRGIAAENAGDYGQASQHFDAARRIDPGFQLAQTRGQAAARLADAATVAVAGAASLAQGIATQRQAVNLIRNAPPGLRQRVLSNLSDSKRAVLAEVLGQDRVGQAVLLELIFRSPGITP